MALVSPRSNLTTRSHLANESCRSETHYAPGANMHNKETNRNARMNVKVMGLDRFFSHVLPPITVFAARTYPQKGQTSSLFQELLLAFACGIIGAIGRIQTLLTTTISVQMGYLHTKYSIDGSTEIVPLPPMLSHIDADLPFLKASAPIPGKQQVRSFGG